MSTQVSVSNTHMLGHTNLFDTEVELLRGDIQDGGNELTCYIHCHDTFLSNLIPQGGTAYQSFSYHLHTHTHIHTFKLFMFKA